MPGTPMNPRKATFKRRILLVIGLWLGSQGCANVPYRYSHFHAPDEPRQEIAFEYGEPHKVLDSLAWVTGIWSRILTLNSHVNNHELTDETKAKLTAYLEENDLDDVLIRVNQYDPKGEWQRLRANRRIGPGWRYTAGMLYMTHYTLLPGRVFGGDQYSPFTNTMNLNSDVSAIVMHEAAYAKDIRARALPGTYAVVNELPGISLWRHTLGVNDILGYAQANEDWMVERETYRVVYPQMGIHATAPSGFFVPFWDGFVLTMAGAAAGHVTGQAVLSQRTKERNLSGNEENIAESVNEETAGTSRTHRLSNWLPAIRSDQQLEPPEEAVIQPTAAEDIEE